MRRPFWTKLLLAAALIMAWEGTRLALIGAMPLAVADEVEEAVTPPTQETPAALSVAAQVTIPEKTADVYRPQTIVLDWPSGRSVWVWTKGYVDKDGKYVPLLRDSYTFEAADWEALRTHESIRGLLARGKTFLSNQGKL